MWLLILEMLLAAGLFALIVWWTMFHGRHEDAQDEADDEEPR